MGRSREDRLAKQALRTANQMPSRPVGDPVDHRTCRPYIWRPATPKLDLKGLPAPESGWVYAVLREENDHFGEGYAFLVQEHGSNIFITLKAAKRAPGGRIQNNVPYLVRLDPQSVGRPRALEIKEA